MQKMQAALKKLQVTDKPRPDTFSNFFFFIALIAFPPFRPWPNLQNATLFDVFFAIKALAKKWAIGCVNAARKAMQK